MLYLLVCGILGKNNIMMSRYEKFMSFVTNIERGLFVEWSICVTYFGDVALARFNKLSSHGSIQSPSAITNLVFLEV